MHLTKAASGELDDGMTSVHCPPHLDTVLGGFAHRHKVRHNVGHQVSAHFHSGVEVILEQTAWQLHSF